MARHNLIFDKRNKKAKKFPLKIMISHKSNVRYILTGYVLHENEWNAKKYKIKSPYENAGRANTNVGRQMTIVGDVIEELSPHINRLHVDKIKAAAQQRIVAEFDEKLSKSSTETHSIISELAAVDKTCFYVYAKKVGDKFIKDDRVGSSNTISDTIISLKKFTSNGHLPFTEITEEFLISYEAWYLKQINKRGVRNKINGLGFRLRDVRRVFKKAIKDKSTEVILEHYPFGEHGYSIKKEKTVHRDIDASEIAKIFELKLSPRTRLIKHLDFFKFCFECWGMNFADLAFLRVYEIENGRLKYKRRKTKWAPAAKAFDIELSEIAQEIIDRYTKNKKTGDLVFPILNDVIDCGDNERIHETFKSKRSNHIRRLKSIGERVGISTKLSTYVGRHSFFSIALVNGVSKSAISELAGHANYQTTETYMSGFKDEQLTSNAATVRSAIGQAVNNKVNANPILADKIILVNSGKETTIHNFIEERILDENRDVSSTDILISILKETNCEDGVRAQRYLEAFLNMKK